MICRRDADFAAGRTIAPAWLTTGKAGNLNKELISWGKAAALREQSRGSRAVSISSVSFWQQDQNWLTAQQTWSQQLAGTNAAVSAINSALTTKSSGIASIANQQALTRVTNELQTAASAALKSEQSGSGNSTSSLPATPTTAPAGALGLRVGSPNLTSASTAASLLSGAVSGASTNALASMLDGGSVNILA
jgi:hypothetical protein